MSDLTDIFEFRVTDAQTDAYGKMTGSSLEGSILKVISRHFGDLCADKMSVDVRLDIKMMPSLHDRFIVVVDNKDCDNSCIACIMDLDGYEYGRAVASWRSVR